MMIAVLSLVVAILAVFFGPLIMRANVQRQIRATARETGCGNSASRLRSL